MYYHTEATHASESDPPRWRMAVEVPSSVAGSHGVIERRRCSTRMAAYGTGAVSKAACRCSFPSISVT
jgi:hypothetical protein